MGCIFFLLSIIMHEIQRYVIIVIVLCAVLILCTTAITRFTYYYYYFRIVEHSFQNVNQEADKIIILPTKRVNYRLGDLIVHTQFRKNKCDDGWGGANGSNETLESCTVRQWPDSIASLYLQGTKKSLDLKLLNNILLKKEPNYTLPDHETVVFHIRVGDVIDYGDKVENAEKFDIPTASDFWDKKTCSMPQEGCPLWSYYVLSKNEIKHLLVKLKLLHLHKICLVYGVHTSGEFPESKKYLTMYKQFCEMNGFEVETLCHVDADESLIYMCNSKYFVPSRGGFSKLVASIVTYRGNRVIW